MLLKLVNVCGITGGRFHGGAVVCNYAYDSCYKNRNVIAEKSCPPAATYRDLPVQASSKAYCDVFMQDGGRCTVGKDCQVGGVYHTCVTHNVLIYIYIYIYIYLIDLGLALNVLYGVKYIDLVSHALLSG